MVRKQPVGYFYTPMLAIYIPFKFNALKLGTIVASCLFRTIYKFNKK